MVPHDHLDALESTTLVIENSSGNCSGRHPLRARASSDSVECPKNDRPKNCGGYQLSHWLTIPTGELASPTLIIPVPRD
jgi:ribosomal protein L32